MSDIITQFVNLGAWGWMILAGLMLCIEIILPGTFMLWFGVAAFLTGVVSLIVPIAWQVQALVFIIASVASILVGRKLWNYQNQQSDEPHLNKRGHQYIGNIYTIENVIENGAGKIRIGDSVWSVSGPDCPVGSRVRVTGIEGNQLLVEQER